MSIRVFKDIYYLKNFDAYSKPLEDFRIKTISGAIVSLISGLIIILLSVSQFNDYLKPEINQELYVDVTRGEKLPIHIDIIFPQMGCDFLSLDAMDVSGEQQLDVDHEIYKIKLDKNLKQISPAVKLNVSKSPEINKTLTNASSGCGSCYGAETDKLKCCDTCEQVREAYRAKGWALQDMNNIKQCLDEGFKEKLQHFDNEGCRMHGKLEVNKNWIVL